MLFAVAALSAPGAAVAQPGPASPPPPSVAEEQAKALFFAGMRLVDRGDYQAALEKYRAAHALVPRAKLLLNIAAVLLELGQETRAANTFERYLSDTEVDRERIDDVRRTLGELDARLGRIVLEVEVDGADVHLDAAQLGRSPLHALVRVSPGAHYVSVELFDGSWKTAERVAVLAGERVVVRIRREAEAETEAEAGGEVEAELDHAPVKRWPPRDPRPSPPHGRLSLFLRTDVDLGMGGAVLAPGALLRIARNWQVFAGGLLGGNVGFEAGTRVAVGEASLQPIAVIAMPIFMDQGLRAGGRGAVGVMWTRGRVRVAVDVGAAYALSVPEDHDKRVWLSSLSIESAL